MKTAKEIKDISLNISKQQQEKSKVEREKIIKANLLSIEKSIEKNANDGKFELIVKLDIWNQSFWKYFVDLGFELEFKEATDPSLGDKDEIKISWL